MLDQLSRLKDHQFTLCLATSKAAEYAVKITAHFGIDHYLDHQFGSELDGTRSGKAELLKHGLDVTNANVHNAVMVGDRCYDINGARANGMAAFGVLYGYTAAQGIPGVGWGPVSFTKVGLQFGLKLLLRIVQPGAHSAHGAIHDIGNFLMTKAIYLKQSNHGSVLDRQFLHRLVQSFLKFLNKSIPLDA